MLALSTPQASLLDMTKYVLDFEIDAPIVVFPVRNADNQVVTSLIINLGHFVIRHNFDPCETDPCQVNRVETSGPSFGIPESLSSQHAALFKTFTIRGSEISAAFVDGDLDWPDNQFTLVDAEEPPVGWSGARGSGGSLASSVSSEGSGTTISVTHPHAPPGAYDQQEVSPSGLCLLSLRRRGSDWTSATCCDGFALKFASYSFWTQHSCVIVSCL